MKIVMYSFLRRFFSAFSAEVNFRLRFAMIDSDISPQVRKNWAKNPAPGKPARYAKSAQYSTPAQKY